MRSNTRKEAIQVTDSACASKIDRVELQARRSFFEKRAAVWDDKQSRTPDEVPNLTCVHHSAPDVPRSNLAPCVCASKMSSASLSRLLRGVPSACIPEKQPWEHEGQWGAREGTGKEEGRGVVVSLDPDWSRWTPGTMPLAMRPGDSGVAYVCDRHMDENLVSGHVHPPAPASLSC